MEQKIKFGDTEIEKQILKKKDINKIVGFNKVSFGKKN